MFSVEDIQKYCASCKGRPTLILDTNLLILLLVGLCDQACIKKCGKTRKYSKEDFLLLTKIFNYFKPEIVITPHILAELSNLSLASSKGVPEYMRKYYFHTLVDKLKMFKETPVTLSELISVELHILIRLGFSDVGIVEVAKQTGAVILTDDGGLTAHAHGLCIPCIQFETVRTSGLVPV